MKKIILLNKILFFFGLLLLFSAAKAEMFKAEEFFLDNGLRVVVIENHKAPIIKQMLWYNVGAVDDGLGKGGRAHFLEHLMFRGTDKIKDGELNKLLENNGVKNNAFTSYEFTAYHEFADIGKLELLLAIEADRMTGLNFNREAFDTEKKVVIQERKQVVENSPSAPFSERLQQITWGNHPFGRPITGLIEEIEALTYEDVKSFYTQYYAPNNAILILAGDIDAKTAEPLVKKYFGQIKSPLVTREKAPVLQEDFHQRLEMKLPHIQTPKITWKYILPPFSDLKGNVYDYSVLAKYLGSGQISALYRKLVDEQKTALSVSASFGYLSRSNASFSISLIPADDVSVAEAEAAMAEALKQAVTQLDEKKLASTKKKMVADLVYVRDNPDDSANLAGYVLSTGFSLEHIQHYETDVEKVTLAGVKNAYREVFSNSPEVIGVLMPETME